MTAKVVGGDRGFAIIVAMMMVIHGPRTPYQIVNVSNGVVLGSLADGSIVVVILLLIVGDVVNGGLSAGRTVDDRLDESIVVLLSLEHVPAAG